MAVLDLKQATGRTYRDIARLIHSSRASLQRLASGKTRFVDRETVLKVHELAEQLSGPQSITKAYLQDLLQRVHEEALAAAAKPASEAAEDLQGEGPAAPVAGTGIPRGAPVPVPGWDRRNDSELDLGWPVDELAVHLDNDRFEHAMGMLDYAGGEAPAVESAAAIQACRTRGFGEAAETLLRKVRSRPADDVLRVIGHLISVGDYLDAQALTPVSHITRPRVRRNPICLHCAKCLART
ncbi:hypothetical protein [Actinomadura harenae]|uniref:Uncharacterized protein n=1 Tax=Actinomadura harenae TaxID=2483351 RepID=A0A3M2LYL7_9ACTN|nr:hypothetical protein [Actinomadura harenae]RMI42529.1 hypothetical protein EBO15_18980 [Actinomadura harenae]